MRVASRLLLLLLAAAVGAGQQQQMMVAAAPATPVLPCNPKAHPVETCPDGKPCPPSGMCPVETWWQLNATDCDANDNVGTCSGSTVEACEKECDSLK
eukprot:COSAG05_NODE_13415_length_431_cov_1.018072_1_plen_97_part_01